MNFKIFKLDNGLKINSIILQNNYEKSIRLTIHKGYLDDPLIYSGSFHYLEHLLGSFFGKYGHDNFLNGLGGLTTYDYLYIVKDIGPIDDIRTLLLSLKNYLLTESFDLKMMNNEKLLVHNEHLNKLDKFFGAKVQSIFEQIKFNKLHSSFGSLKSLNDKVVEQIKQSLTLKDYMISFINLSEVEIKKYSKIFENIKLPKYNFNYVKKENISVSGKYLIKIYSHIKYYTLFLNNMDEDFVKLILYAKPGFKFKGVIYYIHAFDNNSLFIYNIGLTLLNETIEDELTLYLDAFVYYINNLLHRNEIISSLTYIDLIDYYYYTENKNGDLYKSLINFIQNTKIPVFKFNNFMFFANDESDENKLQYNIDSNLYYRIYDYNSKVKINYKDLRSFGNITFKNLKIFIDYKQNRIYSNYFLDHLNNVFLKINIQSTDPITFFVFFLLSDRIKTFYSNYNFNTFVINSYNEQTTDILKTYINEITYKSIFGLINNIKSELVEKNNRNNLFFLIDRYIKEIDIQSLTKKAKNENAKVIKDYLVKFEVFELSRYILKLNELDCSTKYEDIQYYYEFENYIADQNKYHIIKGKSDNIIISFIYLQFIYYIMDHLIRIRRIYSYLITTSIGFDYYIIILNVPVPNLINILQNEINKMDDLFDRIGFIVDLNIIVNNIIKIMLFNKISNFNIDIDLNDIQLIKRKVNTLIKDSIYNVI